VIIQCYAHPAYHCDGIDRPQGVVYHEVPDELVDEVKRIADEDDRLEPICLAMVAMKLEIESHQ
jgi:hypothetical protein